MLPAEPLAAVPGSGHGAGMALLHTLHQLLAASPAIPVGTKLVAVLGRAVIERRSARLAMLQAALAQERGAALEASIFHAPWWLDAVSAQRWHCATVTKGGKPVGSLPYVIEQIGPLHCLTAPPLTHTLGPAIQVEGSKPESRQRSAQAIVGELLDQLPAADRMLMTLPPSMADTLPFQARGWRVGIQHTFLLDCARPVAAIWADLRDKTRNLIRRADERLTVVELTNPGVLIAACAANLRGQKPYYDLNLLAAAHAAAIARDQGRILGAYDDRGRLHAAIFVVWDRTHAHYLVSTRDDKLGDPGAVSLLLWHAVKEAQARQLAFDFSGVISAATAQFMMGFGGRIASRFVCEWASAGWKAYASVRGLSHRLRGRPASRFQGVEI